MGHYKDKALLKRGKGQGGKKDHIGFGDYSFVDVELTAEEKEIYRAEHDEGEFQYLAVMQAWADLGYKLSLSTDKRGGGALATLTGRFGCGSNEGLILTARAGTIARAVRVLCYKDFVICGEGSWEAVAEERVALGTDIG